MNSSQKSPPSEFKLSKSILRKNRILLLAFLLIISSTFSSAVTIGTLYNDAALISFEGSAIGKDNSSFSRTGSVTGAPPTLSTSTSFIGGQSGSFSGNGHLTYAHNSSFTTENYTITFWVKYAGATTQILFSKRNEANGAYGVNVYADNRVNFVSHDGGAGQDLNCLTTNVSTNEWQEITVVKNFTNGVHYKYLYVNGTSCANNSYIASYTTNTEDIWIGERADGFGDFIGNIDHFVYYNKSLTSEEIFFAFNKTRNGIGLTPGFSISSPPKIIYYNLTSEGGLGCTVWNTTTSTQCTTSDSTPTIKIITDLEASCRIGRADLNFTAMNSSQDCYGGSSNLHTCTLNLQDELTEESSFVFIGCRSIYGYENRTSTSGALPISISIADLETLGNNAILGAASVILPSYSAHSNQRIYARNSVNQQFTSQFDIVIKSLNKIWAFNVLTGNDTAVGGFNITPTLYILEFRNSTPYYINQTVQSLITQTR